MLGNVVNQKLHKNRRKLNKGKSLKSKITNDFIDETDENHKITEFFPRTIRKTESQKKKEKWEFLKEQILQCTNEKFLEIYYDSVKGRGIRSKKEFKKGEFVVEYKGELISDQKRITVLEALYDSDPQKYGSYVYHFKHADRKFWVDATVETVYKGRLINHGIANANLQTKSVDFGSRPYLILIAKEDINSGDELLYNYGERSAEKLAKMPWLAT